MRLKTVAFIVFLSVMGIIMSSYFVGIVLTAQVIPFSSIGADPTLVAPGTVTTVQPTENNPSGISFLTGDVELDWIPWIIKQASILIGGLSLIVFVYAGVSLIIRGDNEEELGKSMKMIIFGIIGIALAAFSYTIIANVLLLL